jgi:hypothetical protein
VATFREIYRALGALPAGAPAAAALDALPPPARDAWQRLVDSAHAAGTLDWDAEYAGAVQSLEEREMVRSLPPITDVGARREKKQQLSPEARQRLAWREQAIRSRPRPTDARSEG